MLNFLATTALEEFWDHTQPMLFLGEWCRLYHRKAAWEKPGNEVLPDPYNSRAEEYEQYTLGVYEKILPIIAEGLNRIHGTQHSLRYWQIVIGSFLVWYIQTLYHRFLHLKQAYNKSFQGV